MRFKKIYLEITNICNLNCSFCIKNKRKNKFMQLDEFKLILEKIKSKTNYLYFHVLGEPLMHPLINEFIDIASKNFKINITTNGYLIDKIKNNKNIRQLNISLHSFNDDYGVTLDKYLENIFDSIGNLLKSGTYISLRLWVKSKYNDEIIKYINNKYKINIPNNIINYKIKENLFINNTHTFIWPDLNNSHYNENGSCKGLVDHIGVLVDGTVVPCCLDGLGIINLGNIFESSIDEILDSEYVKDMINGFKCNKKVEELCRHCNFK